MAQIIKISASEQQLKGQKKEEEKEKKEDEPETLSPSSCAVLVEDVEVLAGKELAAVDAGLDGAESAQDADLLHVADERSNVQALKLRVDGVKAADEVFEKEFKSLGKAEHRLAANDERGDLGSPVVDETALGRPRVGQGYGRRARRPGAELPAVEQHLLLLLQLMMMVLLLLLLLEVGLVLLRGCHVLSEETHWVAKVGKVVVGRGVRGARMGRRAAALHARRTGGAGTTAVTAVHVLGRRRVRPRKSQRPVEQLIHTASSQQGQRKVGHSNLLNDRTAFQTIDEEVRSVLNCPNNVFSAVLRT